MTLPIKTSLIAIALLSVAACSGDPEGPDGDTVTETRMDEVDVLDGTISDDMVNVDAAQSTDDVLDSAKTNASTDKAGDESKDADESGSDASGDETTDESESTAETEE